MSSAIDPAKLKVVELRNELQERGLDTKGNKAALVQRLKEALEKETNTSIPDSSILETSTEDLDASQNEDAEDEPSNQDKSSEDKMDVDGTEKPATKTPEKSSKTPEKPQADSAGKVNQSPAKSQDSKSSQEKTESEAQNGEQADAGKDDKSESQDDQSKDKTTEEGGAEQKGAKRKREGDSPDREGPQKVVRAKSPIKEDEPVIDNENVQLNWYDSDLHLQVDKENFLSAKPFTDGAFGYAWAGVRASHGVSKGKVCFEVKITEEIKWEDLTKIAERRQDSRKNQKRDRDKRGRRNDDKKAGEKKAEQKDDKDKAAKSEETETKKESEIKKETTENGEKEDAATAESTEKKDEAAEEKSDAVPPSEVKTEKMDTSTSEENKPAAEDTPMETNAAETAEGEKKPEEEKKEGETKEGEDKEAEKAAEPEKQEPEEPVPIHLVRIGWSLLSSSLQLGEDKCSYAYESTGKFVNDKQFIEYGKPFAVGDVVGAYLSIDDEYVTIRYSVNGELHPVAATLQRSEFPEDFALFPHVLTRNCAFEINVGQKEEPWFATPDLMKEYVFLTEADDKVNGPTRPETRADCEVILMCGLPGSGKTHWVREHIGSNTDKRYTVIGNSSLLERMTVDGNPLRTKFKGKWSIFVDRLQKCLNSLISLASQRRRNYIIDQTNVFPSAQRRKMRPFEGFKRKAVIVVVGDEDQIKRQALQESTDGKGVPDSVILEMKAAMSLPEKSDWMDEVVYAGLDEAATKEQVKKYNEAGKSAGYGTEKRFRGDRFRGKRNDFRGKSGGRDRNYRDRRFDRRGGRGPRGGGGGGSGGGWRDRQDRRGPPPSREYRGGGGRDYGGRDFRRDSGGFSRNRNLERSGGGGGGRWSGGGGGRSGGGGWSSGGGGGGWNQQSYGSGVGGGYGNWNQGGGGQWKYGGGGGQQGYGGGYGGRQGGGGGGSWDYYGQYGTNQNWNSHK